MTKSESPMDLLAELREIDRKLGLDEIWQDHHDEMSRAPGLVEGQYPIVRFTTGFEGAVPVQAYGFIGDDLRFYFRYRSDKASIAIGPVDHDGDVLADEIAQIGWEERGVEHMKNCTIEGCLLCTGYRRPHRRRNPDMDRYYPHKVLFEGEISDVTGDPLAGAFGTAEEAADVFSRALEVSGVLEGLSR